MTCINREYEMKKPVRILLVEDEAFIAMNLDADLQVAGYNVLKWVTTGEDAITLAQSLRPDLILMDIRLAGHITGIQAARQIQKENNIPIIFMTGYPLEEVREQLEGLTILGLLLKPILILDVCQIIEKNFPAKEEE